MITVRSAWSIPRFRKLWAAGLSAGLGAEIGELALPSLALITLGATAAEASWVRAGLLAPFLVVTLWLGVVVDRRRRRPLMIAADVGRGVVLVTICVLALVDLLSIPMLVAAAFALGTMTVLYQLSDFSFLPLVVPDDRLVDANAKVTATHSAVSIAGSGIGGALVQILTAPIAVAINAIGYFGSAFLIGRIRGVTEPPTPENPESAVRAAWAGLRVLWRNRVLRALVSEASTWNFGNEIFMLALAVQLLGSMSNGPLALGVIVTCGGAGAFVGSLVSARLTARFGYGRSLITGLFAGNTAPVLGVLGTLATGATIPLLCTAFVISGVGIGIANAQATTVRQLATKPEIRGRVNAGYRLLSWGALSIGALLGGVLATLFGPWSAALAGAVVMATAGVPVALSPVRRMRTLQDVDRCGVATTSTH